VVKRSTKFDSSIWIALIAATFIGALPGRSQDIEQLDLHAEKSGVTISIDRALEVAQDRNPRFRAEVARSPIADAEILTAKALPNPTMLSDNGIAEDSYRLGIQQTFLLGGKIKNRVRMAQARKEALSAELRSLLMQLRRDVRAAYAQLYVAQERKRILHLLVEHYDAYQHATNDFEDQVQIEFIETSTRTELKSVIHEEEVAMRNLNALMSQPLDTALIAEKPRTTLKGNLSQTQIAAAAAVNSPSLAQNRAEQKGAESELALARSNRIPNFTLAGGPDLVTPPEVTQFNVFVIGYLDLPVFNRQRGPIQEAQARQSQLKYARNFIQNRMDLTIANAYSTYTYTLARLTEHERQLIPQAQDLQIQARAAHRMNKLTTDTLVEADTHRANMELTYLKLLGQNQEAISDLESASGLEL
jgi:outer membrane protein, heavy metal efflux system